MEAMNDPLIVDNLHKRYGDREVVAGISFTLAKGECFGLLGPNGAGKTTTLRCCLGLTAPDGGSITLVGEPVPERAREARMREHRVRQVRGSRGDERPAAFTEKADLALGPKHPKGS